MCSCEPVTIGGGALQLRIVLPARQVTGARRDLVVVDQIRAARSRRCRPVRPVRACARTGCRCGIGGLVEVHILPCLRERLQRGGVGRSGGQDDGSGRGTSLEQGAV
jgi:hypothetical protein